MKRSQINQIIREGMVFFAQHGFSLPPLAFFKRDDWRQRREEIREIFDLGLGWDVTSFGTNHFKNTGLLLFTLRNGKLNTSRYPKPYAEKIMMVLEDQVTPCHFHRHKSEDIINRGGGNLVLEVWQANGNDQLTEESFEMSIDGIVKCFAPGERLILEPGQSVCFEPHVAHRFHGEAGKGPVMVGEVSMVNDDTSDNCFLNGQPRFDVIDEDEPIEHFLASDYAKLEEV